MAKHMHSLVLSASAESWYMISLIRQMPPMLTILTPAISVRTLPVMILRKDFALFLLNRVLITMHTCLQPAKYPEQLLLIRFLQIKHLIRHLLQSQRLLKNTRTGFPIRLLQIKTGIIMKIIKLPQTLQPLQKIKTDGGM